MTAIPRPAEPRPLSNRLPKSSPDNDNGNGAVHHSNAPLPGLSVDEAHGLMRVASDTFELCATRSPELIDITDQVDAFVAGSGITHGQLLIHSLHTTAAIIVNEHEPLLHEDVVAFLEALAPIAKQYRHDDFDVRTVNMNPGELANAHAHLRHLMLGSTEQLPVIKGRVVLGRWQRIFVVELDVPRTRQVVVQLTGIKGY